MATVDVTMKQWNSLVALHSSAPSHFPQLPSTSSLCPSPPWEAEEKHQQAAAVVRLVGCDSRVRMYQWPVTARELMRQQPRLGVEAKPAGEGPPSNGGADLGDELEQRSLGQG